MKSIKVNCEGGAFVKLTFRVLAFCSPEQSWGLWVVFVGFISGARSFAKEEARTDIQYFSTPDPLRSRCVPVRTNSAEVSTI